MKPKNFYLLLFLLGIIAILLTWSPWLDNEEVRELVRGYESFKAAHPDGTDLENPEIFVTRVPYGRWVTTYESGWFIGFWEGLE